MKPLDAETRRHIPPGRSRYDMDQGCPLQGQEHGSHWFSLGLDPETGRELGKQHCIGWHEFTRDLLYSRARFHRPFVRGRHSNLIHRSAHRGWVVWFPENFHQYGPSYIAFWDVEIVCKKQTLRNPTMLSKAGVDAALPYPKKKHPQITLCPDCFPSPANT